MQGISFDLREFHAAGNYWAAFAFDAFTSGEAMSEGFNLDTSARTRVRISLIEVMTFDDDGLITDMRAYWSPDHDMVRDE